MSINNEIQQIKEAHSSAVIEKAKNEERLMSLNEQKAKIEQQCQSLGIKPEDLATEKNAIKAQIEAKLNEAREKLGLAKPVQNEDNYDAPF